MKDDYDKDATNSSNGPVKRQKLGQSNTSAKPVDVAPPPPSDPALREMAAILANFVANNGRQFEHAFRQNIPEGTPFKDLFDESCSYYKYYEYRLAEEEKASSQAGVADSFFNRHVVRVLAPPTENPPSAPPPPSDPTVREVADKLASFVAKNVRQFEHVFRQKSPGDTPFKFLFDESCSGYKYYEYRIAEEEKALSQARDIEKPQSGTATRGTRRSTKWRNSLTDLPENVLMEILSRLPWQTVVSCKCVCRIFNDLASSATLLNASPAAVMVRPPFRHLHLFDPEFDPPVRKSFTKLPFAVRRFNGPFSITLVDSCNGLLYLEIWCAAAGELDSVICNPLTNEYISVPGGNLPGAGVRALGFSALTNRYKVLSLYQTSSDEPFRVKIHEVGSGLWRDVETSHRISFVSAPIYLKGAAYMFTLLRMVVDYFDFDREDFGVIALPSELRSNTMESYQWMMTGIGVLGGCLCMYVNHRQLGNNSINWKRFDLWVMRNENSWSKEFVIDDPLISYFYPEAHFLPFQLLSSGEILMLWKGREWFCYHPKYKTMKSFPGLDQNPPKHRYASLNHFVPSFVSLKDQLSIDNAIVQRV